MGLLSAVNVLYARIAFLLTITFFCFKNVNSILDNSYFEVLTHAMNLPALTMSQYSAQLGLFGIIFALMALMDLIPLLEDNKMYFYSIVPTRLLAFFLLTAASYLLENSLYLHNNVVFIYCFCEVWLNFIIYNSLRDEKQEDYKNRTKFVTEEEFIEEPEPFITTDQQIEEIIIAEDGDDVEEAEISEDSEDEE